MLLSNSLFTRPTILPSLCKCVAELETLVRDPYSSFGSILTLQNSRISCLSKNLATLLKNQQGSSVGEVFQMVIKAQFSVQAHSSDSGVILQWERNGAKQYASFDCLRGYQGLRDHHRLYLLRWKVHLLSLSPFFCQVELLVDVNNLSRLP